MTILCIIHLFVGCFAVVVVFFTEKFKLGISCELSDLADNKKKSHEMPSSIISATLMLGALRVQHCKWAF